MIGGIGKNPDFISLLAGQKSNAYGAAAPITLPRNDEASFTSIGVGMGRLVLSGTQWDESVAAGSNSPYIRKIDNAISKIGKTLEEMKNLSKMAEDETLSAEERIDMQVAMTRLQSKLFKEAYRFGMELSGEHSSGQIERALNAITYDESELIDLLLYGKEKIADGSYTPNDGEVDMSGISKYTSYTGENDPGYYHTEYDSEKVDEFARNLLSQLPQNSPDASAPVKVTSRGDVPNTRGGYLGAIKKLAYNSGKITADSRLDETETAKSDPSASQTITTGILLLDRSSAQEGTRRIEQQLKDLAKMKNDLKDFASEMPAHGYETAAPLEMMAGPDMWARNVPYVDFEQKMFSEEVIVRPVIDKEREGVDLPTLLGDDLSHDQRIKTVRNPLDAFMQRADSFFKDKVFKKLGFSMTTGL